LLLRAGLAQPGAKHITLGQLRDGNAYKFVGRASHCQQAIDEERQLTQIVGNRIAVGCAVNVLGQWLTPVGLLRCKLAVAEAHAQREKRIHVDGMDRGRSFDVLRQPEGHHYAIHSAPA